jgi:hypothetical protein
VKRSEFRDLARAALQRVTGDDERISAVAELLERQTGEERRRFVAICRSRAELWRRTPSAHASIPAAREEARARANEAAYIADLIESNHDLASESSDPAN